MDGDDDELVLMLIAALVLAGNYRLLVRVEPTQRRGLEKLALKWANRARDLAGELVRREMAQTIPRPLPVSNRTKPTAGRTTRTARGSGEPEKRAGRRSGGG